MNRIAKFRKVSYEQFRKDFPESLEMNEEMIKECYEKIQLPKRATKGSAGYDFYAPFSFTVKPGEELKIPTGIRAEMNIDWVLQCYPRSSLGFKYRTRLNNTVGIIDSDYFYSDNEGHIQIKITTDKEVSVNQGVGFTQGIFMQYGITIDDDVEEIRNGGFGSTNKQ